ncbi:MAG: hypothetical protein WCI76_03315 [bacterium]
MRAPKFGFDYLETFLNFYSAGSWDALSEGEKNLFLDRFNKVSKHAGVVNINLEIKYDFNNEVEKLKNFTLVDMDPYFPRSKIESIGSLSEFIELARPEVLRLREIKANPMP